MATGGRPTIYNQEILDKAQYYLENYQEYGDVIPSIAGLAVVLGISRDTVYDWRNQDDKKQFSDILSAILAEQEKILLNKGLANEFNSNITKLALGKHGYHDNTKVDNTSSDGSMSPPQRIEIVPAEFNNDEETTDGSD